MKCPSCERTCIDSTTHVSGYTWYCPEHGRFQKEPWRQPVKRNMTQQGHNNTYVNHTYWHIVLIGTDEVHLLQMNTHFWVHWWTDQGHMARRFNGESE